MPRQQAIYKFYTFCTRTGNDKYRPTVEFHDILLMESIRSVGIVSFALIVSDSSCLSNPHCIRDTVSVANHRLYFPPTVLCRNLAVSPWTSLRFKSRQDGCF